MNLVYLNTIVINERQKNHSHIAYLIYLSSLLKKSEINHNKLAL
jgi:hypothetical protein